MPRDKAKKIESDPKNFSSIIPIEEDKTLNAGKNSNKVLPLGASRYGFNVVEQNDSREGLGETSDAPVEHGVEAMSEIKSRVEAVLSRIKAETSEMGLNEGPDYKTAELVKPPDARLDAARLDAARLDAARLDAARVDHVPEHQGSVTGSLSTGSLGTGPLLKSLTTELERRRSELFAQVRIAEARAQEIEERYRETERRLEQELAMRRTAEQRLRELEDEYLHRLTAAEEEELKRLDAESARERAEAQLLEYEKRVKDAEEALQLETEARTQSERTMKEAEARAETASLALAEAERRKAEAEGKAQSAEENARAIEGLIDEAEAIANAARDRYKNAEARMQQEIQLRNEAEARLKEMENELGTLLASDDWNKIEPRSDVAVSDEAATYFKSQVESEQKVRAAAEEARTAAEVRVRQLEEELFKYEDKYRQVEEKHRQAEAGFKKILRKQEAELRSLSEQVTRANSTTTDPTLLKSPGKDAQLVIASMNRNAKLKLVAYGFFLSFLLIGLIFLIYQIVLYIGGQ
jgi:hypothetical protein